MALSRQYEFEHFPAKLIPFGREVLYKSGAKARTFGLDNP